MNKFFKKAVVFSMAMMVAFSSLTGAKAATKTETLDATDLAITAADANEGTAIEKGIFKVWLSKKTKTDSSSKEFSDGFKSGQRINFGGASTIEGISLKEGSEAAAATKQIIEIAANGATTVKVWWVEGGDDNRQIAILDSEGEVLKKTSGDHVKNDPYFDTFDLGTVDGGKIYVANLENNNYIFKVEVTTQDAASTPVTTPAPTNTPAPTQTPSGGNTGNIPATGDAAVLGLVALIAGACVLATVASKRREEF